MRSIDWYGSRLETLLRPFVNRFWGFFFELKSEMKKPLKAIKVNYIFKIIQLRIYVSNTLSTLSMRVKSVATFLRILLHCNITAAKFQNKSENFSNNSSKKKIFFSTLCFTSSIYIIIFKSLSVWLLIDSETIYIIIFKSLSVCLFVCLTAYRLGNYTS